MKVKTLINKLQKLDPELNVTYCTASGDSSGRVVNVSVLDEKKKEACLDCIGTHAFGERLP